jgi:hypothetical protein
MPTPETNDPLDAFLRENEGYVEDAGFTARVITALPRRRRSSLRPVILFSAIVIGSILAALWMPPLGNFITVEPQGGLFLVLSNQSVAIAIVIALTAASLLWSLYAALKWED